MSQVPPPVDQMAQGAQRPQVADSEFPDTVKLQTPGEFIYGYITAVRRANTQYGDRTIIEMNDQTRGPISMFLSNIQLQTALVEGRNQLGRPIQTGDLLYCRFDGKEQLDGGRTVANFAINLAGGQAGAAAPTPQVGGFGHQPPAPAPAPAAPQPAYQQPQQWTQPAPPQPSYTQQPPPAPQQQWPQPAPQQAPRPQQGQQQMQQPAQEPPEGQVPF